MSNMIETHLEKFLGTINQPVKSNVESLYFAKFEDKPAKGYVSACSIGLSLHTVISSN